MNSWCSAISFQDFIITIGKLMVSIKHLDSLAALLSMSVLSLKLLDNGQKIEKVSSELLLRWREGLVDVKGRRGMSRLV